MINLEQGICIIVISFTFFIVPVFADNPTPYDEWDFDLEFSEVAIYQDQSDLQNMIIKTNVSFEGENLLGTVRVVVQVTEPDGTSTSQEDIISDIKTWDNKPARFVFGMAEEGTYTIDLKITPPSEKDFDHIFDSTTTTFDLPKYGLENKVSTLETDTDELVTYWIEYPRSVQPDEAAHAVIDLPNNHTYEQIIVANNGFEKEFPIDTVDIYLDSTLGYKDLRVHLVTQGNIFPMAGAQNILQDYVKFYKIDKELCSSFDCININQEKPTEEFPWYLLLSLGIFAIIPFLKKKNSLKTDKQVWDGKVLSEKFQKRPIMLVDYAKDYGP